MNSMPIIYAYVKFTYNIFLLSEFERIEKLKGNINSSHRRLMLRFINKIAINQIWGEEKLGSKKLTCTFPKHGCSLAMIPSLGTTKMGRAFGRRFKQPTTSLVLPMKSAALHPFKRAGLILTRNRRSLTGSTRKSRECLGLVTTTRSTSKMRLCSLQRRGKGELLFLSLLELLKG